MSNLRVGIQYASGQDYTLVGEGIRWTGVAANHNGDDIVLTFQGVVSGRSRDHVSMSVTPAEATAIARGLLSTVEDGFQVNIIFSSYSKELMAKNRAKMTRLPGASRGV